MANTKSAEKRMRSSERRRLRNRSVESRLRKLEKGYLASVASGNKDEATKGFREMSSALDKAAKSGVIPKPTANRKKSRLAARLLTVK
jgi:small subunit ribosomal protein S20